MQLVGQLKECHTIHAGQLQIGGDNGYLGALARQLLQDRKPGRRRIGGDDVVVRLTVVKHAQVLNTPRPY